MPDVPVHIISTKEEIVLLIDWLLEASQTSPSRPLSLCIDLEGVNLSRNGSISIVTLFIDKAIGIDPRAYLIDVHTLGREAFETPGEKEKTFRDILQDANMPKVFFDVRNDSDALFSHYGVTLEGVEDVQIMENATRLTVPQRRFVAGLANCIERSGIMPLGSAELKDWKQAKDKGEKLFVPKHGGSFEVFNQRPIPQDIVSYCVGDVQHLPRLRDKFRAGRNAQWHALVNAQTANRVAMSQRPDYQPTGPDRHLSPWTPDQNRQLTRLNR